MVKKCIIAGTGCALADFLYTSVRFNNIGFLKHLSKKTGDGGLSPGKLVFTEELEKFSGMPYTEILKEIYGNSVPDNFNIGGPSLVSMIHASQMLSGSEYEVRFYGGAGNDETSEKVFGLLKHTPLDISNYKIVSKKPTAFTDVFSDPTYDEGHGERTFVNNIGAAWDYSPDMLHDDFFRSQIICFGGTALVPQLHDELTFLLRKAKQNESITLVNSVFDFRNEKRNPGKPWPLGNSEESYKLIDVLIMDQEESLKISGRNSIEDAALFFSYTKVKSFVITNGACDILAFSNGQLFERTEISKYPVSKMVTSEVKLQGDTTGCGGNFAGGIIASLAWQLKSKEPDHFSLTEALSWAVASGGFACSYVGGTYFEKCPGEKLKHIEDYRNAYLKQVGGSN